jgi:branched-chain amino acid transport system ATP-binding protein
MLEIKGLQVSYGVIPVLHAIDLEVDEGRIIALLGSNGAGKTSLLKTISGLLQRKSGRILFKGKAMEDAPPHKIVEAGIAHIPEGRMIFPFLTVEENLLMGACQPRAWSRRQESLAKVRDLFPILKERGGQQASLLSGGEQQMLVIARGLMTRPALLLIDEPSLGLSPAMMDLIYEAIRTFPDQGITVLLSEQNANAALEIADRGYVLQDGHIILQGLKDELLDSELVKKAYIGV